MYRENYFLNIFDNGLLIGIGTILLTLNIAIPICAQDDFDKFVEQQKQTYSDYVQEQSEEYKVYVQSITEKWKEFKESTRRTWHDYSEDQNSLSSVDFEDGKVKIETIIPKESEDAVGHAKKNIADQILKLLKKDTNSETVILEKQLKLNSGVIVDSINADKYIEEQIESNTKVEKETIKSDDGVERVKVTASFKLVPNHLKVRAEKYLPIVWKYCNKFNLSIPLVMAIIQTESYFNPRAKSHAPAYGLMQLVPKSGGRDAYNYVYKKDKVVSPSYLYVPNNNIELGCGYLAKLRDNEFRNITDANKRRYCMIASYNTGPGNLSKAIVNNRNVATAVKKINNMEDDELFRKLVNDLPYHETRDYLQKVESRRENYLGWE